MPTATAARLQAFGLDHVQLIDLDLPAPGPQEVLVKLHAASLNYRDLMMVLGHYNPNMELPRILGSDAAGEVIAIGESVTRFKVGDRVTSLFFQHWHDGEVQPATGETALGVPSLKRSSTNAMPGTSRQVNSLPASSCVANPF